MKIELFHVIADADCAEVRRQLVQTGWADKTQFRNIAYESHSEALKARTGTSQVPCLIVDNDLVLSGRTQILEWIADHQKPETEA